MNDQTPKIGKKGALREVAKKLTELRKKPLSKEVFEIVKENYENNRNNGANKKVAKPVKDMDV
ncbi:MAG: hypothetical protein BroJett040_08250 [Oligoflexia bacterium]|nr:MAG: hypothetical protein BroJett040_08250 [Oligoflexia bacterium]